MGELTFFSDRAFLCAFAVFAVTSLVFEPYVVFGQDFAACARLDPVCHTWAWYNTFDPIFEKENLPFFLRLMCAVDMAVFGPMYLVLIRAFVRKDDHIRLPGLCFVAAIVYSTVIYFGVELVEEAHRANLAVVVLVNIPYTIVPLLLGVRLWGDGPVFETEENAVRKRK